MRTAIIAAMEEEVKYLKEHINNHEMYEFQGYQYHIGDIEGRRIVVARSGIGKVNAALSTALLLEHFSVDEVINTGAAGGMSPELKIGDIIIGDECIHHDVDATAFGYKFGQIPNMPESFRSDEKLIAIFSSILEKLSFHYQVGRIATGDKFVTSFEQMPKILKEFPDIKAAEMEGAAIAQVCYQYKVPCIIVRSISDVVGSNSGVTFDEYVDTAAKNTTEVLVEFLKQR